MRHFKLGEFCTSPTAKRLGIPMIPPPSVIHNVERLVFYILDPLREKLGVPITITSGWRPHELNNKIGGSKTSQHLLGQAADIVVRGFTPLQVCKVIGELELPFDQLINEYDQWTHVSYGPKNRKHYLKAIKLPRGTSYQVQDF